MTTKQETDTADRRGRKRERSSGRKRGRSKSAGSRDPRPIKVRFVNPTQRSKGSKFDNKKIETIPDVGMGEMRKWIENHYSLDSCFILPREQRAYVQPHKWDFSSEILTEFSEGSIDRLAVKMRPSVNHFLSLGKPVAKAFTETWDNKQEDESELPVFYSDRMGSGFTFDENIRVQGGNKIKAGLVSNGAQYRYLDSGDIKLGCKMYAGALPDWDGKVQVKMSNPDNASAGMNLTIYMLREDFEGVVTQEILDGAAIIPANGTLNAIYGATPALYSDIKAFGFGFTITNADVIGRVPQGMLVRFGFPDVVTIDQPFVWRDFDVWTLINDKTGALKQQYESSNFHCFTALHATITNTQAEIYKGGSVQAAQLSGLSDDKLPHTFEGLDSWLGNRTYDRNKEKSLTKGLHWNYRWEKVQDTFFISRDEEEHEGIRRPSMVCTLIAPPIASTETTRKFSLRLHGALMIEYITEVRDAPVFLAPADTINLLARYCAIRAEMPCLMENPSHWETIKENVKKIINHPVTKTIAKEAAMAGLKLLLV